MAASYDDAVTELHQVPHDAFVSERKRLAGELKAAGDKAGAARLAKLPRPPVSAWVVNQLWWHARDAFEAMLASAARLRGGDLGATGAHREAMGKLRARAAAILADAGHAGSEAILRRVTTTLAAIAAEGGFAPDPPGALGEDRDPPGFETMGIAFPAAGTEQAGSEQVGSEQAGTEQTAAEEARRREAEEARRRETQEARARAEAAAERRRIEQEAARRRAERHRLEAALRTAAGEVERFQRDITRLRGAVAEAEDKLEKARAIAADLEARIADLSRAASPPRPRHRIHPAIKK